MCHKLGKKHPDYRHPTNGLYKKDENGVMRMRRSYNGRRVIEGYGFNALVAWSYDRHVFEGCEQNTQKLKMTPARRAQLKRREEMQDRVGPRSMSVSKMASHLKRNHVTRLRKPK